jgi:hypothetical protein
MSETGKREEEAEVERACVWRKKRRGNATQSMTMPTPLRVFASASFRASIPPAIGAAR